MEPDKAQCSLEGSGEAHVNSLRIVENSSNRLRSVKLGKARHCTSESCCARCSHQSSVALRGRFSYASSPSIHYDRSDRAEKSLKIQFFKSQRIFLAIINSFLKGNYRVWYKFLFTNTLLKYFRLNIREYFKPSQKIINIFPFFVFSQRKKDQ